MTSINKKVFIDATTFLGMNAEHETLRCISVNFFSSRYKTQVFMGLEQVGLCDDVIWQYSRREQDLYYPFMDCLHTQMDIQRIAYNQQDYDRACHDENLQGLSFSVAILMAQVLNNNGVLYTHNRQLQAIAPLGEHLGRFDDENGQFVESLHDLYEQSKVLRISNENLNYV